MRRTIHVTVLTVSIIMLTSCSEAPAPEPQAEVEKAVPEVPSKLDLPNLPDDPKEAARALLRRAEKCVDAHDQICGKGETSLGLLERAIELDPTLAKAYGYLAKFYALFSYPEKSRRHKAFEVCQQMVEQFPEDSWSYICIAIYTEREKVEEKELWARKAVELGPEIAEAHFLLAGILNQLKFIRPSTEQDYKDLDEAIVHYGEGLKLDPPRGFGMLDGRDELGNRLYFLGGTVARGRVAGAANLMIIIIDNGGGSLRYKDWCKQLDGSMSRKLNSAADSRLRDHPDFQPAVAKWREHCENPDLERAVALAKEARTEDRIDEAIAAWEPLFEDERFALDAYLSLFRLYRKGRFSQKWSWFDWKGYDGKARALVVKYFERERDPWNRCVAVRETNFRELLPELYDELQQECAAPSD